MIQYKVGTAYRASNIKVTIRAKKMCSIRLRAWDARQANTVFLDRIREINAGVTESLFVQMPISGKLTIVEVSEENNAADNENFEVLNVKRMNLQRQMDVVNMRDADIRHWVRFVQRFCFNAGVLPAYMDKDYVSAKGGFRIKYVPVIRGEKGTVHPTPAQITVDDRELDPVTGRFKSKEAARKAFEVIRVAKASFVNMTVPVRFCILCHEFAHVFMNEDASNELEADLNGLIIYLGLGYPRREAKEAYLSIFDQVPDDSNFERYEHIVSFIDNFEKSNFEHL